MEGAWVFYLICGTGEEHSPECCYPLLRVVEKNSWDLLWLAVCAWGAGEKGLSMTIIRNLKLTATEWGSLIVLNSERRLPCLFPFPARTIDLILYSEVAHGFQAHCLFVALGAPIPSLVLCLIYCGIVWKFPMSFPAKGGMVLISS